MTNLTTFVDQATRRIHRLAERPLPADEWAEHYDLRRADGRAPMPTDEIPLRRAAEGRGSQFDADLFDTFIEALPRLLAVGEENPTAAAGATSGHRPGDDI